MPMFKSELFWISLFVIAMFAVAVVLPNHATDAGNSRAAFTNCLLNPERQ